MASALKTMRCKRSFSKTETDLLSRFKTLYPKEYRLIKNCQSDADFEKVREIYRKQLREHLERHNLEQVENVGDGDYAAAFAVSPGNLPTYKSAVNDQVKQQVETLLSMVAEVKQMSDTGATTTEMAVTMSVTGVAVVGAGIYVFLQNVAAAVLVDAILGTMLTVGVAVVITAVVLVVLAIVIPIIYFMEKQAACIVMVVNTTKSDFVFQNVDMTHGKQMTTTLKIPAAVKVSVGPAPGTYALAGFYAAQKRDDALVGTQSGWEFKLGDVQFSFGVDCPLTAIYDDNNCWCGFNSNASNASSQTDSNNRQDWVVVAAGYQATIRCNSGSGSIAYYMLYLEDA